jgi:DNA-binding NarL/FixJ family response regulator
MRKMNVLIVDDEALLRQGLSTMLQKEDFIDTILEAEDEPTFTQQLSLHVIDIILLDIRLRKTNGLELVKKLKLAEQQPKVIAVTGLDGVEVIINLLKSGVHGIVYKLDGYSEILQAIRTVLRSGTYFPENILRIIQANAHHLGNVPTILLSFQEKELLKTIASGSTTKQIATELKMSESTTETYRVRLMKKLGVSNTAALLAYAFRNGIL